MTTAVVNFEGIRVVISCDERCGEQVALLVDTTDMVSARRLLAEDVFARRLEDVAALLGWALLPKPPGFMHRCPKCEAKAPTGLVG